MLSRAPADARRTAKHALVDETRGLINAVTMLDVNHARRRRRALVEALAAEVGRPHGA